MAVGAINPQRKFRLTDRDWCRHWYLIDRYFIQEKGNMPIISHTNNVHNLTTIRSMATKSYILRYKDTKREDSN